MFGGLSFGQTADYCEGDDCPEKLTIEGFDVRISPNVYSAPDFTHTLLGQHLDTLKAQLLWMTSKTSVPSSAIEQLIDSGVSIYIDADGFCTEQSSTSYLPQSEVIIEERF